jgi:chitin synthase
MMEVELPTAKEDVDQLWQAARSSLKIKPPEEKEHRDAATKQADHDRNSRTNVVLAWVGTNMCVLFTHVGGIADWITRIQVDDSRLYIQSLYGLCARSHNQYLQCQL